MRYSDRLLDYYKEKCPTPKVGLAPPACASVEDSFFADNAETRSLVIPTIGAALTTLPYEFSKLTKES